MPEGHTVHHYARRHARALAGAPLRVSSPQGRFADGAATLDGQQLLGVDAIGKHALWRFERDVLHIHLGLYGRYRQHRGEAPPPVGQVRLRVEGTAATVDLSGPTACELIDAAGEAALRARLGPDPLDPGADVERFLARCAATDRAIGAVLLDQSVVAGLGNVYRAELLFVAGVDPASPARQVPTEVMRRLWRNAVVVMGVGAQKNAIRVVGEAVEGAPALAAISPDDHERRGRYGPTADRLWVYRRSTCKVCGSAIQKREIGQRTSYDCPRCQTAP